MPVLSTPSEVSSSMFNHDGKQHEYTIDFTTKSPLLAVRIDPSRGQGKIEISNIRLPTARSDRSPMELAEDDLFA